MPIYKVKDPKIMSNFRPISILDTLSKILEKMMKVRVTDYLKKENILCNEQYGFRSGLNTSDAILQFTDKCVTNIDNKLYTIAVYIDLSRTFDSVVKTIMVNKLSRLGFRGIIKDWFRSYLTDRKMFVGIGGVNVNDMCKSSDKLDFIHFADDTTVFMSGNDLPRLCVEISEELGKVREWLICNRHSLDIDKTSFMIFTHSNIQNIPVSVSIGGSEIIKTNCTKFLGLHIDDKSNYNSHSIKLSKKLSCVSGLLRRVSSCIPTTILKQIYCTLFQSVIEYGIVVWGGCGVTNRTRIIRAQNRALSLLSDLPRDVKQPLSFEKLYQLRVLCQLHKYINLDMSGTYFSDKILELIPNHDHLTRFSVGENLNLPQVNKSVTQKQFFYNAILNWNRLPPHLRNLNDRKFKNELRKLLILN